MRNQSGQVIVVFLIMIPPILILLFSVANITLAVRDRVKLQNSADAAVLSGAQWQARGLNQLAVANAAVEAIGLLEHMVGSLSESKAVKQARLDMLGFEKRQLENVKADIKNRIPKYVASSGRENGEKTLLRENYSSADNRIGRDYGAEVFGIMGKWHYLFEEEEQFFNTKNRLFGIAWRKPIKLGVLNNLFGTMRMKSGYALASACVTSERYSRLQKILIPDFSVNLFPVQLTSRSYEFIKDRLGLYFISQSRETINNEIMH
jgi:hypothetical protein